MESGTPEVAQGTNASSPYDPRDGPYDPRLLNAAAPQQRPALQWTRQGEEQETKCRDPLFALLLYGNVGAIVAVAGVYGAEAFSDALKDSASGYNYTGYVRATFVLGVVAIVLSGVSLPVIMSFPQASIKVILILTPILSAVMMVMSFLSGSLSGGFLGIFFLFITVCFPIAFWPRIPFASINIVTAYTAAKKNAGVVVVTCFFVTLAFGWTILWSISLVGVWEKVVQSGTTVEGYQQNSTNYVYLFFLLLSYFFTHQVIQNTMHVTVAGTVGSWWFSPEDATSCCSSDMFGSLLRSLTTSFGSICFGSLLVAVARVLETLARSTRSGDRRSTISCYLFCSERILKYFNEWAFVYVGLYGYSYIEAGKKVSALFKNRGWETIVGTNFAWWVFFFLSLCIGSICAAIGFTFNKDSPEGWFDNSPNPGSISSVCAGLGFVTGLVLAHILYSTIVSAVDTAIVCFAEGPTEFEANHPELSRRMRETWLELYPKCGI